MHCLQTYFRWLQVPSVDCRPLLLFILLSFFMFLAENFTPHSGRPFWVTHMNEWSAPHVPLWFRYRSNGLERILSMTSSINPPNRRSRCFSNCQSLVPVFWASVSISHDKIIAVLVHLIKWLVLFHYEIFPHKHRRGKLISYGNKNPRPKFFLFKSTRIFKKEEQNYRKDGNSREKFHQRFELRRIYKTEPPLGGIYMINERWGKIYDFGDTKDIKMLM